MRAHPERRAHRASGSLSHEADAAGRGRRVDVAAGAAAAVASFRVGQNAGAGKILRALGLDHRLALGLGGAEVAGAAGGALAAALRLGPVLRDRAARGPDAVA